MIVIDVEKVGNLVKKIVYDPETREFLQTYSLCANTVTWEDTARTKGSCWGPNISDMTLRVDDNCSGINMPVIRTPNFKDVTHDLPISHFKLQVGNEEFGTSKVVSLDEYLKNFHQYSNVDGATDLWNERDTEILTGAQCCMLPCEDNGRVEFAVNLYNYQTTNENPAVLVIVATKDGTSAQVLNRQTTQLLFNDKGRARNFVIERLKDVREKRTGVKQEKVKTFKEMKTEEKAENAILIFQVPLVVPKPKRGAMLGSMYGGGLESYCMSNSYGEEECDQLEGGMDMFGGGGDSDNEFWDEEDNEEPETVFKSVNKCKSKNKVKGSGMDMGVISLGEDKGEYKGTEGKKLVRDTDYPIRCTYQFYRVTDEDHITLENVVDIKEQLDTATSDSVASGSLVTSDSNRTTEPVVVSEVEVKVARGTSMDSDTTVNVMIENT